MEQDATLIKDFGPVGQRGGVGNAVSSAPGQVFASFPDDFCRNVRKCQSMSCFRLFFPVAGPDFPAFCARRRGHESAIIKSMSNHAVRLAASRTFRPARRQAHLPTTGPTTISLTALLTHLLTHAPSISTPNSTPNRTICVRSSRARRNHRRDILLRQKCRFV